jgi:beta-glucosidase
MTNAAYCNALLPVESRVADLLGRMTIEEKLGQLLAAAAHEDVESLVAQKQVGCFCHVTLERMPKLLELQAGTRLRIPLLLGIDAIHGHCYHSGATVFPTQLALSSSWNPELLREVARVTAREAAATGIHCTYSPVLCLARDLRWGRIGETFGEDPFLLGELGAAMIEGYQGNDLAAPDRIAACAKHYTAYPATEGGRDAAEAHLSRRELLATYLPPFERAAKAGVASMMTAYHAIDGVPCNTNRWLLTEVLREQWGWDGMLVTDWNNVGQLLPDSFQHTCATIEDASRLSLEAGNDMMMATPAFFEAAKTQVQSGALDIRVIDEACRRVLRLKFRLGLFDGRRPFDPERARTVVACAEHRRAARDAALQSMVLLKNNGILPLSGDVRRLAVVGPNRDDMAAQFGDWSFFPDFSQGGAKRPHPRGNVSTILDGIWARAGGGCEVREAQGCDPIQAGAEHIPAAVELARWADAVIAVVGDCPHFFGEGRDRANLDLGGGQQALLEALRATGKPLIVVLVNSKPLSIPWVAEHADAIVEAWNPGMAGGDAAAAVLFGDVNPCGKLTIGFPHHVGQQPVCYNQLPGWHTWHTVKNAYVDMPAEPLFPFGFGLSYTTYAYATLKVETPVLREGEALRVSVDVTNTGARRGVEIVQLYVRDCVSSVTTPLKRLAAFARAELDPGEARTVLLEVPFERLALVDAELRRVVEPGEFDVMVGPSSRSADLLKTTVAVVGDAPPARHAG